MAATVADLLIERLLDWGVDTVFANWWSPIGISFGLVSERPVVREHVIVARPTFNLTLNFDVRIMAGAQAAHAIEKPPTLRVRRNSLRARPAKRVDECAVAR